MSATNDNSNFLARLWPQLWMLSARFSNHWPVRACGRALAGSIPVGALVGALSDVPDELPGSSDRLIDLGVAGVAALSLVLLLRWIGKKHGGIVPAIKLTAWSYAFSQSLVAATYGTWLAAGMDGAPDMAQIVVSAVLAVGLFIPSSIMLRRLDPDF
jgi:hypothetical protein